MSKGSWKDWPTSFVHQQAMVQPFLLDLGDEAWQLMDSLQ